METGCWLLGGEFEDSVFEERRERRPGPPESYRAKRCEPQWFYEETGSSDDVEALTVQKFKGDLAYRRQEYQKALQEYSSISEKLPSTNFAMKRDVQEGQARCLVHLGRHKEAMEIATNLENKATNTDHLTTVLYLQFTICSSLQNLEKTIFCLQKLISLHPFNPWNWGKLGEAYLNLGPALSASLASSQKENSFTSSDTAIKSSFPHSGKDYLLCFPETLPESSVEVSSGNKQKNEKALKDIKNRMTEERAAVLLETQMKACASFIRTSRPVPSGSITIPGTNQMCYDSQNERVMGLVKAWHSCFRMSASQVEGLELEVADAPGGCKVNVGSPLLAQGCLNHSCRVFLRSDNSSPSGSSADSRTLQVSPRLFKAKS
nr:uncharacterized protein C8orf76 homolog isoform X3 [Odocoileus virginianus texanus]